MNYKQFIESKIETAPISGFEIDDSEINPILKPHQRDAVKWAIAHGRAGIFERFGLGKTIQELEICRLIIKHKGGKALIVVPLGVRQEFKKDAVNLLGISPPEYVTCMAEVEASEADIIMTNNERVRDGDIDPGYFTVCIIDEAADLRSFGTKTTQVANKKFKGVKYKFTASATPSPNNYVELLQQSGFLEIMDTGQALTRFFQRNSTKAHQPSLYPHMEKDFWTWVGSWGIFISKPSDLGYADEGYELPPIEIRTHIIKKDFKELHEAKDGQLEFMRDVAASLPEASKEKSNSISARVAKAKEIVESSPDEHFILWHDREAERLELKKQIKDVVDVYGSLDYEEREKRVIDFSEGRCKYLATKKSISGSGCNFQKHCHRAVFIGIDYMFEDFIQAVHRIYRFGQQEKVIIDIIYTEAEESVYKTLMEKWENHNKLESKMQQIIKEYGLQHSAKAGMNRRMGANRIECKGSNFTAVLNDSVDEFEQLRDNRFDMILTSIPFSNQFEYSPNYCDFGYNANNEEFFEQMNYLTPHLLRTLKPGRVFACHVKDRTLYGNVTGTGMTTIDPFHQMCTFHYMKHGFQYMGMITVCTDVVRENNQTYRLGWSEQCKDGTKMGVGCPEYVLLFRKLPTERDNAYADEPVSKPKEEYGRSQWQLDAHAFWRSSGDRLITKEEMASMPENILQKVFRNFSRESVYNYKEHVELTKKLDADNRLPTSFMLIPPASWRFDIWDDITRIKTLNTSQKRKRQQMHVCPLQLDLIERLINRYSSEGEEIADPFGGIMSVPYMAVKMKRKGFACELNADYYRDGLGYLEEADCQAEMPTLFDFVEGLND